MFTAKLHLIPLLIVECGLLLFKLVGRKLQSNENATLLTPSSPSTSGNYGGLPVSECRTGSCLVLSSETFITIHNF